MLRIRNNASSLLLCIEWLASPRGSSILFADRCPAFLLPCIGFSLTSARLSLLPMSCFKVLLEFRESRTPLTVTKETVLDRIQETAKVRVIISLVSLEQQPETFLLRRYSAKWKILLTLEILKIARRDRLALTLMVSLL